MLKKRPVWALGAEAGRTLGGVRAAMLQTDGEHILDFDESRLRPYCEGELALLRSVMGGWPGEDGLDEAAEVVEAAHVALLSTFKGAELIGFPGLTLAHEPQGRGVHGLGDGQILAEVLQKPVAWDFGSADLTLGGEGAPMLPFFHFALAKWLEGDAPVTFLNLGAVASLTWVDPSYERPEEEGALLGFDAGPGMAVLDDLMAARLGVGIDQNGALAATGQADATIVAAFLKDGYFYRMPPKSLDRNAFADLRDRVSGLSDTDAATTLTACIVAAIARGMEHCPTAPERLLVAGGGRHNATLMAGLAEALACPVVSVDEVGLDGDMLDAQGYAHLAVRVARGLPTSCPATTGVAAAVGGGVLSGPSE